MGIYTMIWIIGMENAEIDRFKALFELFIFDFGSLLNNLHYKDI